MEPLSGDILVLGLGRSGEAVAAYVARHSRAGEATSVFVADEADGEAQAERAGKLRALGVEVELGVTEAPGADLVVASPGIAPSSPLMRSARSIGVEVISEIEFAFRRSRSPWAAITGTNGKTTTTALVAHLLAEAGRAAETVGNVGSPAISVVDDAGQATVLVAEVSSFQLALTSSFRPRVSVLLNVTEDHVDWHGSMEAYTSDKGKVFENQGPGDVAVIDVDDLGSAPFADAVAARGVEVRRVSLHRVPAGGAGLDGKKLTIDLNGSLTPLCDGDDLLIKGNHNVSNALAAAAAVSAFGVPAADIAKGLRTFAPIEHRLEPAGVVAGVEYYNDSKATNPDAVIKAVAAFDDQPLVLLLGGRNKGNDFRALAEAAAPGCRAVVTFGEAGGDIAAAFEGLDAHVVRAGGMLEAVRSAAGLAKQGDAVVLSPACASFDEFTSYEHRGRVFKDAVAALATGEGSS